MATKTSSKGKGKGKAESKADTGSHAGINADIYDYLMDLGKKARDIELKMSRFFAYSNAARAIAEYDKRIKSGKEAQKLKGVGPKVAIIIEEFLQGGGNDESEQGATSGDDEGASTSKKRKTGDADEVLPTKKSKTLSGESMRILDHYEKLYMDKKTALGLEVKQVKTISDLRRNIDLISKPQAACLNHFVDLTQPISRNETEEVADKLKKLFKKKIGDSFDLTVCGAYRRGVTNIEDGVNILLIDNDIKSTSEKASEKLTDSLNKVIAALKAEDGLFKSRLNVKTDRFEALIQLAKTPLVRRLQIRLVPADCAIAAMFYLTGSNDFVKSIESEATDKEYILNENGLRKIGASCVPGQLIPLKSEEELFEFLEIPFVQPDERN